ncbi:hypothetical protein VTK73DRAFT_8758 [Phialemonium thermophilum]|uniref:Uncharacterized protein n=1 Tax=Phialemonium thermophilum TaxID=223376 RepID=A0ABR3W6H2_9PEZI
MALGDTPLYYACLSYAAHLLTLRGELEKFREDAYEDKAIAALIPRLSGISELPQDDTLAATVVILRMAEQFCEIQDDAQRHLVGASSLFANRRPDEEGSPDSPAFSLYLRQSIRIAILNEVPCRIGGAWVTDPICLDPAPDYVWVDRVTLLLARTCSACWDPTLDHLVRMQLLHNLLVELERWRESLPESFQPWCNFRRENDVFPVVCFISTWHGP